MRLKNLALLLLALLPMVAVTPALAQDENLEDVEFKVGNTITHLKVKDWINGDSHHKLDKSKVYIVDHWSVASQGCKRSIPYLNTLYQEMGSKGLMVVGVTMDKMDAVKNYLKDKASTMTYPIGVVKSEQGGSDMWKTIAKMGAFPLSGIVNRKGQICYIGSPLDEKFPKVLRLALQDRLDPELTDKANAYLNPARRAAKVRNYREAQRLYQQVVDMDPRIFTHVAMELWAMLADQAEDDAAAKAYIRAFIERMKTDEPVLVSVGEYLATNTEMKHRDLDAAKQVGQILRDRKSDDPYTMAAIAAIEAATGDVKRAVDTQYDAWMAAPPSAKPAFKRALDIYREGGTKAAEPTSAPPATAETPAK